MGKDSSIQWCHHTWNPWVGCRHKSPGCAFCYMFAGMRRFGRDPSVVARTKTWGDPIRWNKQAAAKGEPEMVFACSWSDWFIREADPWRPEAWKLVRDTPNLIYQILTKRHDRIADHLPADWGDGYPNVWLGVSVENQRYADERIPALLSVPAAVRFLSMEPLLDRVDLQNYLKAPWMPDEIVRPGSVPVEYMPVLGVDWVIVGGESSQGGAQARPFNLEWARSLVRQCQAAGVPVFVKQLGSRPYDSAGPGRGYCAANIVGPMRDSHGGDWSEWPEDLRVRQFPAAAHQSEPTR